MGGTFCFSRERRYSINEVYFSNRTPADERPVFQAAKIADATLVAILPTDIHYFYAAGLEIEELQCVKFGLTSNFPRQRPFYSWFDWQLEHDRLCFDNF